MNNVGEIIALLVAVLWTISSLASESASRKFGSLLLNIFRMTLTIAMIGAGLWLATRSALPLYANGDARFYLGMSALVGYVLGDFFFLQCFILIGARWGELFMTVAPLAAALTGRVMLGEAMSAHAWMGMGITTAGICLSILSKPEEGSHKMGVKLPAKGIIYGLIAGVGQGVGLVFSKQGLLCYQAAIDAAGATYAAMPFAATLYRCWYALIGFTLLYLLARTMKWDNHRVRLLWEEKRALGLASLSTLTGPCIGVALSLMATMYTSTGITQTIMSLVPVLILAPSHWLFKSKITPLEIVGAIIAVAGVALFFI